MESKVSGCIDCPLFNTEYYICGHPNRPDNTNLSIGWDENLGEYGDYATPEWCPLKKESITISFVNQ